MDIYTVVLTNDFPLKIAHHDTPQALIDHEFSKPMMVGILIFFLLRIVNFSERSWYSQWRWLTLICLGNYPSWCSGDT